jgi:hypothetical protein
MFILDCLALCLILNISSEADLLYKISKYSPILPYFSILQIGSQVYIPKERCISIVNHLEQPDQNQFRAFFISVK